MSTARLTASLAVVFVLIGLGFLFHGADADKLLTPFVLGWALWLLSPYAPLALAARFGRFPVVIKGALVLVILTGLGGTAMYVELKFHFITKSDAQDAIAMLFIPFWQNLIVIPTLALLFATGAVLARRKQP